LKSQQSGSKNNDAGTEGLATRMVAVALVGKVIDDQANLDELTDAKRGLPAFRSLAPRDQALARAITLATLRNHNRIGQILKKLWDRKPPQKARFLIHVLETAVAQIAFMNIPASAAVNLAVTMIRKDNRTTRFASFANAVLRGLTRQQDDLLERTRSVPPFPEWMSKTLIRDHGREKYAMMSASITRENNLDITFKPGATVEIEGSIALPGHMRRMISPIPVHEIDGFGDGNWWVQNIAAAQPVHLLGDVKGQRIADLCAAPGGKTMQLASLGADVTAVDISPARLQRLRQNLERTGLSAKLVEADILEWQSDEKFDAVLLDAPCSATGTIRRHPDILWNKTEAAVGELVELQGKLINKAAELTRPGGTLVYANCSLFKAEGENLVASLNHPKLTLSPIALEELPDLGFCINGQGIFRALPHYLEDTLGENGGMDGFFAARFTVGS